MAVSSYNTNPDLNTTISGINIAEGCPPSGLNNALRQLMADVKAESDALQKDVSSAQSAADEARSAAQAAQSTANTGVAASGVAAGNYGPTGNASPAHGGTFTVPYFTVDAKGRVTSAATRSIKLPADANTHCTYCTHCSGWCTYCSYCTYCNCRCTTSNCNCNC